MKFVVKPENGFVTGYCVTKPGDCPVRCDKQCNNTSK